ncbi:MAG: ABC transporter [Pyrinomonas sp.]|uniref:ABC transporter ATP-binding protein n=1 Tax=Pyrinomonas sp. TaxID=2080306 RepID=UPI003322D5F1
MRPSASSDGEAVLVLDGVTKRFDDFTAVDHLSLVVRAGRVFGLLGPNGAGKTTTIRMIVDITAPDEGAVLFRGQRMGPRLQNRIGYLPEERGLYKRMRVGEQLRFLGELKGMERKEAERTADIWLERLNLAEWKKRKTDELSKGMQQKVQFIATIMHEPELIILDEVFAGLDPINAELLKKIILEFKAKGRAIIFSTHLLEQAEWLCDDICLINRARKVLDGELREIKRAFRRNAVALRAEGAERVLDDQELVARVVSRDEHLEVVLQEGASPQELLRRLVQSGAVVTKFEQIEPSLREIFISKVSES